MADQTIAVERYPLIGVFLAVFLDPFQLPRTVGHFPAKRRLYWLLLGLWRKDAGLSQLIHDQVFTPEHRSGDNRANFTDDYAVSVFLHNILLTSSSGVISIMTLFAGCKWPLLPALRGRRRGRFGDALAFDDFDVLIDWRIVELVHFTAVPFDLDARDL